MAESKYALLLVLAQEKADAAARRMQLAQKGHQSAQNKLTQLTVFLDEYRQRLTSGGVRGMGIGQWQDFQRFLQRLQEAVQIQQGEQDRCLQHFLLERRAWQHERKQLKAFEKLLEREQQRALALELRREQRSMDEFAVRGFWQGQGEGGRED